MARRTSHPEANGTASHMKTPLDLEGWMEFGQAGKEGDHKRRAGKAGTSVAIHTFKGGGIIREAPRFERRLQEPGSRGGGFPLPQVSLHEPPCHREQ